MTCEVDTQVDTEVPTDITPIPDEWKDPVQVLPHVAGELRKWLGVSRGIEHDLQVVLGALDADRNRDHFLRVHEWLTSIQARLTELNHEMGRKVTVWDLIAQDLQRHGGQQ